MKKISLALFALLFLCQLEGISNESFQVDSSNINSFKVSINEKKLSPSEESTILKNITFYYFSDEQHDSALVYAYKLADLAETQKNDSLLAFAYSRLGVINQNLGRFAKANEYNFKGLELKKRLKLGPKSIAESHVNIAFSYLEVGPFNKAIEHQEHAIKNYKQINDSTAIASSYNQIGAALYQQGKYDSAKTYYDKAYEFFSKEGQKEDEAVYYIYIGLIHLKMNRLNQSIESYQKALKNYPADGSTRMKIFIYSNLAVSHLVIGAERDSISRYHLNHAITNAQITYDLSKEISFLHQMRKATEILYKAYHALGQNALAMDYSVEFINLNDSIFGQEKINAITEARTKFETKEKELEIDLLAKDIEIKNATIKAAEVKESRSFIILISISSILLISIGSFVFIYKNLKQKQKIAQELESNYKVIEKQSAEKELLLKEIHHRVKNNLQVISSLLDLQSMDITDDKALSAVSDGQSRVKSMALIHQNLYQNENLGEIFFGDYVAQLCKQIAAIYSHTKKIDLQINTNSILLDIDTAIPIGLILNELISNAYKYAFQSTQDGVIRIQIEEKNKGEYELNVSDTGPGLQEDFDFKKSKSLGLRLVKRLTKQLYGSVSYHYENGANFKVLFKDTNARKTVQ